MERPFFLFPPSGLALFESADGGRMDRKRLIRFAEAEGEMQRRRNIPLRTSAEVAETLIAYARTYAIASGNRFTLKHSDIRAAERAFRRCRRLRARPVPTSLPLLVAPATRARDPICAEDRRLHKRIGPARSPETNWRGTQRML